MTRIALSTIGLAVGFAAGSARAQGNETARAIGGPEPRAGMSQLGAEASLVEPDAYNLQLKKDIADNAAPVKAAGIPIDGGQ